MRVSITASCYSRVVTTRGATESVLAQDYDDAEFMVVDGSSTDGSLDIIREYAGRISIIISEPGHGTYKAINKGIRVATGEIIGLLHSDDFFYDNRVIGCIVERIKRTHVDFLHGDGLFMNPDNTNKVARNWIGEGYHPWKVRHGWLPPHPICYTRHDVIMRLGLYNESYKIAAGSDLLVRYLLTGGLTATYLNEYIVRMCMGGLFTDNDKRKKIQGEGIRVYISYRLWSTLTKLEKTAWEAPQFVFALLRKQVIILDKNYKNKLYTGSPTF